MKQNISHVTERNSFLTSGATLADVHGRLEAGLFGQQVRQMVEDAGQLKNILTAGHVPQLQLGLIFKTWQASVKVSWFKLLAHDLIWIIIVFKGVIRCKIRPVVFI